MEFYRVPLSVLVCAAIALLSVANASAAQTQSAFQVTSSVPGSCIVTVAAMEFGTYLGRQIDQTSIIAVTCTKGAPYQIGLDNGPNYSAPNRRLKHRTSADYLIYELYRDAGRTARWGDDDASNVQMTGDGNEQHINLYGRVPAGQSGPSGSYSNTTTVTVNF